MVTMRDIAQIAGVSVQTVSNVINNRDTAISEKNKKKILKLIEKHGYKPSRVAQSLRRGRTETIGLVVPDMVYHPFYPKIFDVIESELRNRGFNIVLFNTREDILLEEKAVDELLKHKVDGIIFIRIVKKNPYLEKLPKDIPIVACLRAFEYLNVPSVLTNNKRVGFLATDYLIKKGHKKIIHIAGNQDLLAHRERKEGYVETLKKNNIYVNQEYIVDCDYKKENLNIVLLKILKKMEGYTAIFAYNDIIAVNCIKALVNLGYKIPGDISVIGVDDMKIGEFVEPSLTTIKQPIEEMCLWSVKLLVDLIKNKKTSKRESRKVILCDPVLVERDSVKNII